MLLVFEIIYFRYYYFFCIKYGYKSRGYRLMNNPIKSRRLLCFFNYHTNMWFFNGRDLINSAILKMENNNIQIQWSVLTPQCFSPDCNSYVYQVLLKLPKAFRSYAWTYIQTYKHTSIFIYPVSVLSLKTVFYLKNAS